MGVRIRLNLASYFDCVRQHSCLFVDFNTHTTVKDVEERICRVFGIPSPVLLLKDGWYLPSDDSVLVFKDDDLISVFPSEPPKLKDEILSVAASSQEDISGIVKKRKKRRKDKNLYCTDGDEQRSLCEVKSLQESIIGSETSYEFGVESLEAVHVRKKKTDERNNIDGTDTHSRHFGGCEVNPHENGQFSSLSTKNNKSNGTVFMDADVIHKDGTAKDMSHSSEMEVDQSLPEGMARKENENNDPDQSETSFVQPDGPERRRKRTRRRKKNRNSEDKTSETIKPASGATKQSNFLLHKKLLGVSHFLQPIDKKHIFFSDNDVSQLVCHSATSEDISSNRITSPAANSSHPPSHTPPSLAVSSNNSVPTKSPNGSVGAASVTSAGELSKLLSLGQQQSPQVFERKKVGNITILAKNDGTRHILTKPPEESPLITEIPSRDTVINFKVLKMVNYTPQLSEVVTAKVCSTDVSCGQLQVEILRGLEELQEEKGKFTLEDEEYQEDVNKGSSFVSLNWNEIIEPRLANHL